MPIHTVNVLLGNERRGSKFLFSNKNKIMIDYISVACWRIGCNTGSRQKVQATLVPLLLKPCPSFVCVWSDVQAGHSVSESPGHRERPLSITERRQWLLCVSQLDAPAKGLWKVCHALCCLDMIELYKQKTISKLVSRKDVKDKKISHWVLL